MNNIPTTLIYIGSVLTLCISAAVGIKTLFNRCIYKKAKNALPPRQLLDAVAVVSRTHIRRIDTETGNICFVTPALHDTLAWVSMTEQLHAMSGIDNSDYCTAWDNAYSNSEVEYNWDDDYGRTRWFKDVFYPDLETNVIYCLTTDISEVKEIRAKLHDIVNSKATLDKSLRHMSIESKQLEEEVTRLHVSREEISSVGREDVAFLLSCVTSAVDYMHITKQTDTEVSKIITTALNDIVNTLEDMSWIAKGKVDTAPLQSRNVNIPVFLRSIYKQHSKRAANRGVRFKFVLDADSPSDVRLDFLRVRTALDNIVRNAYEHSQGSLIIIEYKVHHDDNGNPASVTFKVTDDGVGIPLNKQGEIFERFKRSSHSKYVNLGLHKSYEILKSLDGTLTHVSDYTDGTMFEVVVPAYNVRIDAVSEKPIPNLSGLKVLILTQSQNINTILMKKLKYMNAETYGYTTVKDAVDSGIDPDYVITDYVLNTVSLADAVIQIETVFPYTNVIVLENDYEALQLYKPLLKAPYTFDSISTAISLSKQYKTQPLLI